MPSLNHQRIMITRPERSARELCRLINESGGEAIHFPAIAFAGPPSQENFLHAVSQLDKQDWLIFISPQAVYASAPYIKQAWPSFPDTVKWAVIGRGTAKALRENDFPEAVFPEKNETSEGLLALPPFQFVKNISVAVIRGAGGQEKIDQVLTERGAQVLPVIAYQRTLPDVNIDQMLSKFQQKLIDAVVCTSFESAQNLKKLLGEKGWPFLQNVPLLVTSQRIKMLAQDLGFRRIWVTNHTNPLAILEKLAEELKK